MPLASPSLGWKDALCGGLPQHSLFGLSVATLCSGLLALSAMQGVVEVHGNATIFSAFPFHILPRHHLPELPVSSSCKFAIFMRSRYSKISCQTNISLLSVDVFVEMGMWFSATGGHWLFLAK
jgi:hypothetical protein